MAILVNPNPQQHQYVVGIDFGHGETSAAICNLQWNVSAGRSDLDTTDIRINDKNTGNEKVLVSAISIIEGEKPQIGENAFDAKQLDASTNIRVCFKQPPMDIDGSEEKLMSTYMAIVYQKIREMQPELTDDNHVVYIARPSGWIDKDVKERYCQMALNANIPLAGLTSESRAAIFYALNNPKIGFARQIDKGAIVFDLGSSTLDFTYLAQDENAIDYGYPLGASIIDKAIFVDKFLSNEKVRFFLENNPQYENALLFEARKIKEDIYKRDDETAEIDHSFLLSNVISKGCQDYQALRRECVEVEYSGIVDLNNQLEQQVHYLSDLEKALQDFKENHIPNKTINGVFLTGGASRMNFIRNIICKTYGLTPEQVRLDPDNPSLTISRGIAMLGRADSVSNILEQKLLEKISHRDISPSYDRLVENLAHSIGQKAWQIAVSELTKFKNSSTDLSVNDLEKQIRTAMYSYASRELKLSILNAIQQSISSSSDDIRQELNKIISFYAPGRELKATNKKDITTLQTQTIESQLNQLTNSIVNTLAEQVTSNVGEIIADIIWAILGLFLWGVFYIGYKVLQYGWNHLTKTEEERKIEERKKKEEQKREAKQKKLNKSTREECYQKIMEQSPESQKQITNSIMKDLSSNQQLRNSILPEIERYSKDFVLKNIQSVRIPIE